MIKLRFLSCPINLARRLLKLHLVFSQVEGIPEFGEGGGSRIFPERASVSGQSHVSVQFYYLGSLAGCLFAFLLAVSGMVFICVTNNVFPKNLILWSWFKKLLYSVCETA